MFWHSFWTCAQWFKIRIVEWCHYLNMQNHLAFFFYVFPVSGSGGIPYLKIVNFLSSDIRRNTEPGWKICILGWRLTFIRWHSSDIKRKPITNGERGHHKNQPVCTKKDPIHCHCCCCCCCCCSHKFSQCWDTSVEWNVVSEYTRLKWLSIHHPIYTLWVQYIQVKNIFFYKN